LLYHQALLLEDVERTDEAIDAYAASASRGHSADVLICLSALLLRVGRAADALVPADEARSRHPLDGRGHLAAGRAAIALNRTADAEAFFRKALDVDPACEARPELARALHSADAEAWFDAARAWQALGQEGRARKLLDEALRLDPDHAQARRLRSEGATAD